MSSDMKALAVSAMAGKDLQKEWLVRPAEKL